MVAGALASAGVYVGESADLLTDQEDNPHGFWEREDVVALNDAILAANGAAWFSPSEPPLTVSEAHRAAMHKIMGKLPADASWLLKDPRQVITWPLWEPLLGDPALVYVYRSPLAVATSLQRRNGFPLSLGLLLWEYYNRQVLTVLQGRDALSLSYEVVAANPSEALAALVDDLTALGVSFQGPLDEDVFDTSLGKSGSSRDNAGHLLLSESQRELARYCEALCQGGELPSLPPEDETLLPRLRDLASSLAPLARAMELQNIAELCEERTRERDQGLSELHQLEANHSALADAHKDEQARHRRLERQHQGLVGEHEALADAHRVQVSQYEKLREKYEELLEKADYLFATLSHTYHSLLQFELSPLARIWRFIARSYKLLTFRRGQNTSYDDALDDAARFLVENGIEAPRRPQGKGALLGDVARYVFTNPAGSARSFSLPRLKRAVSVFLKSSPEDLEVWVNSRFPERDRGAQAFDIAALDAGLDTAELCFPLEKEPLVSIVIPVYNDYRVTINCLQSVLEHTSSVPYEIVIADDCSTDLTSSITERVANIRVVRGENNLRFLGNCNRAAKKARGKYILFLNNDTAVCEHWLAPLVDVMERDAEVGIVGPKLLFGDGKLQEAGAIMWRDGSAWNFGRSDDPDKPEYNYLKETDYVSGACLLIRTDLWQQLGGFDTRFSPAYYEDADLAFAARAAGFKVIYQPLSRVFHFEGVSNGTDLEAGVKQYQVRNQAVFREKWSGELDASHYPNASHVFKARDRSQARSTILVIDHYVPHHDKDAGSRSTFMYIQLMLEMGYRVIFLGANYFPHKPYTENLQQMGVEVLVGEYMARNQDRWLQENASYIDCIYLHRPHVAEQFLGSLEKMQPRPPIIFMGHDLHYLRIGREREVVGDKSLDASAEKWRKREYAVFDRVDKVYYPSQVEVDEIHSKRPDLNVRAIPLYALDSTPRLPYVFEETRDILFVGGFNHPPNVDAICWFASEVLPRVCEARPDIRVHVVGSNPTEAVESLQDDHVVVYGYLSDQELDVLYGRTRQVIAPLRFGAGVKGKVLEAIQKNRPLVTTSIGMEGIPDAAAVMSVADTAQEFAARVIEIDQGDPTALAKVASYPAWLQSNFSRERAAGILLEDFGPPFTDGSSCLPIDEASIKAVGS